MAKAQPKSNLPEGFVPLRAARSAGFFVCEAGNRFQGFLRDMFELDDNFNKGKKKTVFKIELTADGTKITDAETKKERSAEAGEVIGVDEKGYLRALREVDKGTEVIGICTGQQAKGEVKKGRNPAWIFELGKVPI